MKPIKKEIEKSNVHFVIKEIIYICLTDPINFFIQFLASLESKILITLIQATFFLDIKGFHRGT